ncbi:hypothetical protein BH11PLA2_BH11PLA2_17640 [soil metagenome]
MRGLILYSGAMAQVPRLGGLAWFHLQFLLGFHRLGYEVLFLDRLDPGMCVNAKGKPCDFASSDNLRYFLQVLQDYGLQDSFSLSLNFNHGEQVLGKSRSTVMEKAKHAVALINVMGYCNDADVLASVKRRVFLDIDPGFGQMWRELGLHDAFAGHNRFATLARNIGQPRCTIPTCGLDWITLPQPVVLEHWPVMPPNPTGAFTSIGAWRGPNGPVEYNGHTYGLRCHEFRKFFELPSRCPGDVFEQAMAIHPNDLNDIAALNEHGWRLADPLAVAGSPQQYRDYIVNSKGEFVVPKQMYVDTGCGLLSDRSAYYLASGHPVLARDTGLNGLYPTGEGLLTFKTLEEAAASVESINSNYTKHCSAARRLPNRISIRM